MHVTRDGGKTWDKVTPPDLPDFTRISLIEASPHQNGVAYLAGNRYQQGDRRPYVYKTADFGKSWQKIVTGIPATDFARTIREDPKRRGLLYVGTETGIYISFNDGASWQSLRLNLPVTPVHGIVVEDRDLVIGTHGRGFYILDDINVLRQAGGDITSGVLHVFQPTDPLRGLDRNIAIDYYLGKDADQVKIEFVDDAGKVLRSFTGSPKDPAPQPGGGGGGGPFGAAAPRVGTVKGMNRFTWDLRQEGAVVFPGMIMWAAQPQRGPASPPGKYAVRVTAHGETRTRDFAIGLDPRLKAEGITEAYLQEQFKLSSEVRDRVTTANTAVIKIRALRDQVNDRLKKVPD
ncbi:MAG: glycosyl hydrolase, partial [Vicinamibacterales bacterium]